MDPVDCLGKMTNEEISGSLSAAVQFPCTRYCLVLASDFNFFEKAVIA